MITSVRPNFFLLLDLDPDAVWEQAVFEKTLSEKRIEWSRQSAGVARKALIARQNLALIAKIREVMTDQALREQEAVAARREQVVAYETAYAQFEKQLALLNAKDVVEQEEIERFIAAFEQVCPASEIRSRLRVQVAAPNAPGSSIRQALDIAVAQAIADRLQFLHLNTLYELLQLPGKTATASLFRAAEQLYTRLVVLQPTAETTAQMELAGLAREVFKSDEMRASYDERLRLESLEWLFKELEESVSRAGNQEIHQRQVMIFLDQARKDGWGMQEALERLKEHARQRRWIVTIPLLPPQEETLLCPNCRHLNRANQYYCTTCQQALYIDCPRCGMRASCEYRACGQCGFEVGNRYLVDRLLEEAAELVRQGDGERASEALYQAAQAWPSGTQDERTRQIMAYQASIQSLVDTEQQAQQYAVERLRKLAIGEELVGNRHSVRVSWELSGAESVVILQSAQPLQQEGQVLPVDQLDQQGQRLEQRGNCAIDDWRAGEVVYYTPVLLLHQRAIFGPSQRYACVENVRNLTYQHLGAALRLRWDWPRGCEEVLLSSHTETWPEHHAPSGTTAVVSREQYDKHGYYDVRTVKHHDQYIVVSAVMTRGKEQFQADGVCVRARLTSKVVITYEITQATLFGRLPLPRSRGEIKRADPRLPLPADSKKRSLRLMTEPYTPLPVMLLVSKQGGLPVRKEDGRIFQRIKATMGENRRVVINLTVKSLPPNTFCKLFFEDDAVYGEFTIHHPDENQMRLS